MDHNQKTPSKRLFVGSLPYKFTEGELLSLFVTEGKIVSVKIIHNQWGKSRGMGYVEFENEAEAVKAKNKFHNYKLGDRTIIVDYAEPDPFLTPEGQARHQQAIDNKKGKSPRSSFECNTERGVERHERSFGERKERNFGDKKRPEGQPSKKFRDKSHVRQSVFESRNFGSKIGAKFSSRSRKKRK
jgi:RNA recognition motif-containing protein